MMGDLEEEPIVFKVFYEEDNASSSSGKNSYINIDPPRVKEVRKLVFSNHPNFKQLYDRLVRIEHEKQNPCREIIDSSLSTFPQNIRIEYIDEDGDRISIACNDDLQNLVNEKKPHVRIHVNIRCQKDQDGNPASPVSMASASLGTSPMDETIGVVCSSCHATVQGFRYKCVICSNFDLCSFCEQQGTHPVHDMIRISSSTRLYPPHFFTRLSRLFERIYQQQPNNAFNTGKRSNGMPAPPGMIEPMAREMVDEETDIASDYDMETFSTDTSSSASSLSNMNQIPCDKQDQKSSDLNPDALPSIEELTRNVQDLTEQDLLVSSGLECLMAKNHCKEAIFDDKQEKEKENTEYDSEKLVEHRGRNDITSNSADKSEDKKCDINSNKFPNKVDAMNDNKSLEGTNSNQDSVSIENTVALQKEIENLLAPLSKEVSISGNDDFKENICVDNLGENHLEEKKISAIGDFIETHDPKKHNVTPTNTKSDFSLGCQKDDEAALTQNEGYIQCEKRARFGSISESSSTCSSSPFELCEAEEGAVVIEHHAVIETNSSASDNGSAKYDSEIEMESSTDTQKISTSEQKNNLLTAANEGMIRDKDTSIESMSSSKETNVIGNKSEATQTRSSQLDYDEIETIESTEYHEEGTLELECDEGNIGTNQSSNFLEQPKQKSIDEQSKPLSLAEQRELLRVVENHERLERARAFNKVLPSETAKAELDDYWLASSRLMLKNRNQPNNPTKSCSSGLYDPFDVSTTANRIFNNYTPTMYNSENVSPLEDLPLRSNSLEEENTSSTLGINETSTTPTNTYSFDKNPTSPYLNSSIRHRFSPKTTSSFSRSRYETSPSPPASKSGWRSRLYGDDGGLSEVGLTSTKRLTPLSSRTKNNVTEARDQMISMGFSDDDGWLTQLLEMKNGNIEEVIDVLTPVNGSRNRI